MDQKQNLLFAPVFPIAGKLNQKSSNTPANHSSFVVKKPVFSKSAFLSPQALTEVKLAKIYNVKMSAVTSVKKKVLIMGAPGSGKGTQCALIVEKYGLLHLSTGDLLRAAVREGTPLGLQAKDFMENGMLVPDELVINLIKEGLSSESATKSGWLLDGFPRTDTQADEMALVGIVPELVIIIDVPEQDLVERIVGRRSDPVTGKIYHMTFDPPPTKEIEARLTQRSDDREDKVRPRVQSYNKYISILEQKYADKLVKIKGTGSKKDVFARIIKHLEN